jgi:uncharacterized protein with ParB-like and HNH nuclease domain
MNTNAATLNIQDVFKYQLKIDSKVVSIETLFMNARRAERTNYKPEYQRNYVWDEDKATYFIESVLLGTEIPPIIFFVSEDKTEVIDGRQRYETIKRFMEGSFRLKSKGLLKLKDLKNKHFDDLKELKDVFWVTKLRIIEFSFRDQNAVTPEKEELLKKEIFKRYNSGITPLKSVEIDKAKYEDNTLNKYLKKQFTLSAKFRSDFVNLFSFDKNDDIEILLRKLRQQLVVPYIPINYYSNSKIEIIERFFNYISDSHIDEPDLIYKSIVNQIDLLLKIKKRILSAGIAVNRVIMECLFWALQVMEREGIDQISLEKGSRFIDDVVVFIKDNTESYPMEDSNFYQHIIKRYFTTANFIQSFFDLDLAVYLANNIGFRTINKELADVVRGVNSLSNFKAFRLSKPDASSNTIEDICMKMRKNRFSIRPSYQRQEVIDGIKSSAIIESILLGIKLPPIFVYVREDGVEEVLDGQQRLLSILGYLGKGFTNEKGNLDFSKKNNFALKKLNILEELNGKRFSQLPKSYQDRILDFDMWVIEISSENNVDFDPIDLFIRLNYKPFPILENTFEMWNSYIDREIINKIKAIYDGNSDWFYLRKDNKRMETETLVSFLAYLEYSRPEASTKRALPDIFDVYRSGVKTNIRMKSKSVITNVLEDSAKKVRFLESCDQLENTFIKKLKLLVAQTPNDTGLELKDSLDDLINVNKARIRSYQNFYALWYCLLNITIEQIEANRAGVYYKVAKVIKDMKTTKDIELFHANVEALY